MVISLDRLVEVIHRNKETGFCGKVKSVSPQNGMVVYSSWVSRSGEKPVPLGTRGAELPIEKEFSLMLADMVKKPQGEPVIECQGMEAAAQARWPECEGRCR